MSQLIARLLLAMMLVPCSIAVFLLLVFGVVARSRGGQPGSVEAAIVWLPVSVFVVFYWVALWRSVVRWTPQRVAMTALAWIGAAAISATVGSAIYVEVREAFPAACAAGALTQLLWVLATIVIWRESGAERAERLRSVGAATVACPSCGYNLTGLRETRCPECGASFPLEDLIAAQRDRLGSIEQ